MPNIDFDILASFRDAPSRRTYYFSPYGKYGSLLYQDTVWPPQNLYTYNLTPPFHTMHATPYIGKIYDPGAEYPYKLYRGYIGINLTTITFIESLSTVSIFWQATDSLSPCLGQSLCTYKINVLYPDPAYPLYSWEASWGDRSDLVSIPLDEAPFPYNSNPGYFQTSIIPSKIILGEWNWFEITVLDEVTPPVTNIDWFRLVPSHIMLRW